MAKKQWDEVTEDDPDVIYIDRFSAGLDELTRKQQASDVEVLKKLSGMTRFSIFEATENDTIARKMDSLRERKLIEVDNEGHGFPWSGVSLTEAGLALLGGKK